jgi:outer membrane immunogenic protein
MRRDLLTGVSAIALAVASVSAAMLFSTPADAADLRPAMKAPPPMAPAAPVFSWTGCYVGAHVGWGWGHANSTETSFAPASFSPKSTSSGINTNGALFGGQVGCNYQFAGAWVVGIQGDFAGTDINGRANDHFNSADPGFITSDATIAAKTEWLASVTGRIGWAAFNNQALFYFKGGGAWARNQWDVHDAILGFNNPVFSENRSGWTVGGGVEWTLWSPNWTAFVEYNFYDFNSGGSTQTQNVCGVGCPFSNGFTTGKMEINTVKVGVNYKLNWFGGGY